ncbi:MAG: hypothetical protein Q8P20_01895 [bacterium]|nr:hypothetical protein [bacterium]
MIPYALAAETAEVVAETTNVVQNIDWTRPTWDLFIILFFVVAVFLYGLSLGRDRIIVILVSIYMALAIVEHAPFLNSEWLHNWINNLVNQFFVFQISAFLILFIVLFLIITRSALMKTIASSDSTGPWWQILLYSVLHVGLIVSIVLSYLPKETVDEVLAPLTKQIFTTDVALSIWMLGPVVAMIIFKGTASKKRKNREEADEE